LVFYLIGVIVLSADIVIYLFMAGMLCGAINALAGGATLIGFPVLISVGLSPSVANASNFLATMPGYAAAIPSYAKELRRMKKAIYPILIASMFGGGLGSVILVVSPSDIFVNLTPYLLFVATLLYAAGGVINHWVSVYLKSDSLQQSTFSKVAIFSFSIYGGYFGAGLGIIILSILKIIGYQDFHESNAIKNIMITLVSLLSIAIFIAGGLIAWPQALVMMAGSTLGGFLAAKQAKRVPQKLLRYCIIVVGFSFSGYYFYQL
jgi:uncharacterized membrane protein YfcA